MGSRLWRSIRANRNPNPNGEGPRPGLGLEIGVLRLELRVVGVPGTVHIRTHERAGLRLASETSSFDIVCLAGLSPGLVELGLGLVRVGFVFLSLGLGLGLREF